MATFLITGSSRSLGLALVAQLASQPASQVAKVFASSRSEPSKELQEIINNSNGRVTWIKLDIVDKETVKKAVTEVEAKLGGSGLDVLVNNSGVIKWQAEGDGIETMYSFAATSAAEHS